MNQGGARNPFKFDLVEFYTTNEGQAQKNLTDEQILKQDSNREPADLMPELGRSDRVDLLVNKRTITGQNVPVLT